MRSRVRATVVLPVLGVAAGTGLAVAGAVTGVIGVLDAAFTIVASLPGLALGALVVARRPDSPAGPALLGLVSAPVLTYGIETWAMSVSTADPWLGAAAVARVGVGIWVLNLAGFVVLCLTFPDGPLPGRTWRVLLWLWLGAASLVVVAVSPSAEDPRSGSSPGPLVAVTLALFLVALLGALGTLVVRYRRGDDLVRRQLRWLLLGVATVPVLLMGGWLAETAGASTEVAYTGFVVAMVVLVPVAVTVAILREDLLDVDRLLGRTAAWLLTSVVSAAVFALVVLAVSQLGRGALAPTVGVTTAAFVTALLLLPLHRRTHAVATRLFDRERSVTVEAVRRFVRQVSDGEAEPEQVEAVLARALGDDRLRVLLAVPGTGQHVDLRGRATAPAPATSGNSIPLAVRDAEVAVLVLGRASRREIRLARELAVEARLPIEVSRLRLQLRGALADVRDSRARLVEAAAGERRRLERDLHDGAQQRILAVGMRLRSAQARFHEGDPTYADLDAAVAGLEATVGELRRIAHGIRPSGLDDGLAAAVRLLVVDSPVPVEVSVPDVQLGDAVASTAYYVIAEALANALKHAQACTIRVTVAPRDGQLDVEVSDDGRGGAQAAFGLTALQDRVVAHGGRAEVHSPLGGGTTVRAVL